MDWYIGVLKKYVQFNGRARRKEYWMFLLFNILISLTLSFVDEYFGTFDPARGIGTIGLVYAALVFLPTLAVTVRRLHDTNRSGWWALVGLIPLGVFVLLALQAIQGDKGDNRFGADPKGSQASTSTFTV
ncbi:DUF805 domain-containing protein [Enterovibrio sp. ZSDZ35]|uniref:DUF805 domain-containing protein n=1 Tax=Enterovibrio qingdaonensis TaxID=2899818 RepID=A0ABT5QTL2_9GAMM|nr:DUF805 domain-containing protein [Enterovibrio sp. ZSDZ35]MDD1784311.1 DUF805 domain-containing protein [Enterovibrio sp. ZSDZ35]